MKDLPALFKAFIIPFIICYSFLIMGFLWAAGQDIPMELWGILGFFLSEEGIKFGVGKLKKGS